ncbi:MAG: zinc dependent phospholipase C family protein [Nitrospinota bacterium]|nr:zinc dependent phospholipase C family protein [Nitrospinota bacterium]
MMLACLIPAALILLLPGEAWAWGAGVHVAQGSFILENLELIEPQIAAVISAHPLDYIYGCISADIFIGKGIKRRPDHCHNWSVGLAALEKSKTTSTRAYSYGYLTHLAADVIAHNFFIPRLLCLTPTASGAGHVYWEFRADRFVAKKHWKLANHVISIHNHDNDDHIKNIVTKAKFGFKAKKLVYKRAIHLSDLATWRDYVTSAITFGRMGKVTRKSVNTLSNYSLNLVVDLLRNWESAVCLRYDPVGSDYQMMARHIRQAGRTERKKISIDEIFAPPQEILDLDYVDHGLQVI